MHPRRRTRLATLVTVLALSALGLTVLGGAASAVPALPIPPGPLDATVPSFIGKPVADRPVDAFRVPAHPFMARTGFNSMHDDAYATDAGIDLWAGSRAVE